MFAATTISRPTRLAFRAPALPDAPRITLVDAIVLGAIGLTLLALVAPAIALAVLVVGGVLGAMVLVSGMSPASPIVDRAHDAALTLAIGTEYSFSR